MIIYLAGGFTTMQKEGREMYLVEKFCGISRLMSFWFHYEKSANILQIFMVKKELMGEQK